MQFFKQKGLPNFKIKTYVNTENFPNSDQGYSRQSFLDPTILNKCAKIIKFRQNDETENKFKTGDL